MQITEYYNALWPTISFYDTRGRLIQERSLNHLKGIEINNHTYIGLTVTADASEHKHTTLINGINYAQTEKYIFSYDAEKRLTSRNYYLQNQLVNRIVITYNPMGDQVIKKEYKEGGTIRQTVDYKYNIKGWLTTINDPDNFPISGDYFYMQLFYDQKLNTSINCLPRYNGNISYVRWQTKKPDWSADNEFEGEKGYAFNYDKLNRLSGNSFYEYISGRLDNTDAYQELINEYDKNGNIKSLKRQGKSYGSPITIDNLTYTYTGNQVTGIDDAIPKDYYYDFYDNGQYYYISHTPEYLYDANGNLTQDLNKEIINISYNELNLPEIIDFKYNNRIEYQYDALGNKKRQVVTEDGKQVKTIDFIGNFVYENDYPVYNSFDEGRIIYRSNGTYFAETYIKDHLGNIRVAFGNEVAGDPLQYGIRQVNAYYPFGMNINTLSASKISKYERNEYLYNGKMFQDELGLDWLDYGARFYDPVLSVWLSVDPMLEKYPNFSGYAYCSNNPIVYFDPNGMLKTKFGVTDNGEIKQIGDADDKPDELYAITENGAIKSKSQFTVKDKTILPELAKNKMDTPRWDGEGTLQFTGSLRTANSFSDIDMANIFLFASKNSSVEWGLYTSNDNGRKKYSIGTFGWPDLTPSSSYLGIEEKNVTSMIHAHVDNFSETSEDQSMAGDRVNVHKVNFRYYMFGSELNNFYQVTEKGSKFIQKITTADQLLKYMK